MVPVDFKETICHTQVFAELCAHPAGGLGCFPVADFCCTAGTQFAPRQIEEAYCFAHSNVAQQRAATAQLDIVRMYADRKDIYFQRIASIALATFSASGAVVLAK